MGRLGTQGMGRSMTGGPGRTCRPHPCLATRNLSDHALRPTLPGDQQPDPSHRQTSPAVQRNTIDGCFTPVRAMAPGSHSTQHPSPRRHNSQICGAISVITHNAAPHRHRLPSVGRCHGIPSQFPAPQQLRVHTSQSRSGRDLAHQGKSLLEPIRTYGSVHTPTGPSQGESLIWSSPAVAPDASDHPPGLLICGAERPAPAEAPRTPPRIFRSPVPLSPMEPQRCG